MKYTNYTDYSTEQNMYAMHTAIRSRNIEELKYMEELFPEDGEHLDTWIRRTARHVHKLTEYAYHQHIYGTKRTWSCHESSRYCFICTLSQMLDILRNMALDILELGIKTPLKWIKQQDVFRLTPINQG